jgi:hypothetical protein
MNEELAQAALSLAQHIHGENYSGLIVSGDTSKISQTLVTAAWQKLYPDEAMPKCFVFNGEANSVLYKNEMDEVARLAWVRSWIANTFPELTALQSNKLCYIDEFIKSGEKYRELHKIFEKLGFSNIEFAFFASETDNTTSEVYIAKRSSELAGELIRMSLEVHGYPSSPEEILKEPRREQQEITQDMDMHLRELGDAIKRK